MGKHELGLQDSGRILHFSAWNSGTFYQFTSVLGIKAVNVRHCLSCLSSPGKNCPTPAYPLLYLFRYKLFNAATKITKKINKSEVLLTLAKREAGVWPRLLSEKRANVKLDFERACDSDDLTDSDVEVEQARPVPLPKDVSMDLVNPVWLPTIVRF